jgi:hypothetical protein
MAGTEIYSLAKLRAQIPQFATTGVSPLANRSQVYGLASPPLR